jgi:large subunit ribosomal protein L11
MGRKESVDLLGEGGKFAAGPATAPRLSAMKVNIGEFFKKVNEATKSYAGMQVPVKVKVDSETKEIEVEVGTPPVSSMIKKELGIELARITEEEKTAGKTSAGDLKIDSVVKVAKAKYDALLAKDLKAAVKQVLGTANSMPITVEGKRPREVIKEVAEGKWDQQIQ